MFKKIFSMFFVCLIMVATNAYATPAPCYRKPAVVTVSGLKNGKTITQSLKADYAVYFDTGYPHENDTELLDTTCKDEVLKNVIDEINNNKDSIHQVLILGMADSQGASNTDRQLNAGLGYRRMEAIRSQLDSKLTTCDANSESCAQLSVGDSPSITASLTSAKSDERRAAFIWVLYKRAECTNTIIDGLADLLAQINALPTARKSEQDISELKGLITEAQTLCNTPGTYMLSGDNEKIHQLWRKAINVGFKVKGGLAVKTLVDSVNSTRAALGFSASEWRTQEGGFNYSRLISDSIAGVVLGTAGGLITSHIVKKNQLNSGFANVMCTIAGQSVASYGDLFTVGIQQK